MHPPQFIYAHTPCAPKSQFVEPRPVPPKIVPLVFMPLLQFSGVVQTA